MKTNDISVYSNETEKQDQCFNPFQLVSDREFQTNLNVMIAFYQILKSRKKRAPKRGYKNYGAE